MAARLPNGLTTQQDDFARNVAKGMTQREAALQAGYAPDGVDVTASRTLRLPKVQELITNLRGKAASKVDVDIAFVVSGLKENAMRCQQAIPVLDRDGDPIGEYKFDSAGSNRAYELLGKYLGAFIDRSQIELSDGARRHIDRIVRIVVEEVHDQDTIERIMDRIEAGE